MIIEHARAATPAAPLTILTLGAVTNVASAILMAPDIVPRIRLWSIMLRYEAEGWSRSEFNANNDQLAVDALFATPGLDLTVMTATASRDLVFSRAESGDKLAGRGELGRFLLDYWDRFVEETPWWDSLLWKEHRSWRMWDVALVEALLDPRLGERRRIEAPALQDGTMLETTVDVFTAIDAAGMADRFWRSLVPPEGSR
jgi:inosine-uridine nucleoside N-ribohydrolase